MKWLSDLSHKLSKTRQLLSMPVGELFRRGDLTESFWNDLEDILLEADVGVLATDQLISKLREVVKEERIKDSSELIRFFKREIARLLGEQVEAIHTAPQGSTVILIVGVNGSGKTTTIGKLASLFKGQGKKVFVGAADTFRAAAIEQLEVWAQRAGVELVKHKEGADPAAVAYDAVKAGNARGADVILIDTAGRLHTKSNLMEELKKIRRVIQKEIPSAPHETLLVLDATTGQNALHQAKIFKEAVEISGIILTKLDGSAKGGAVLAIRQELQIPIKFIGLGESAQDLHPFDPSAFADALLAENESA